MISGAGFVRLVIDVILSSCISWKIKKLSETICNGPREDTVGGKAGRFIADHGDCTPGLYSKILVAACNHMGIRRTITEPEAEVIRRSVVLIEKVLAEETDVNAAKSAEWSIWNRD